MQQSFQWRERGQCVRHRDEGKCEGLLQFGREMPGYREERVSWEANHVRICQVYYHDVTIYISLATGAEERGRGEI